MVLEGTARCRLKWGRNIPDSKVHRANMGPIWGQQDPGGPHVGPMNFAFWDGAVTDTPVDGLLGRVLDRYWLQMSMGKFQFHEALACVYCGGHVYIEYIFCVTLCLFLECWFDMNINACS